MAVTKIIPIRFTIQNSIDYICNPDKTDDRLLVHSENCFPHTAGLEFEVLLRQSRAGGNTIGRHLIQSFAPGEVTPGQAHEIGKKLADEILKGEYAYVMATHIDRGCIHNHFVWCASNIVTHKKYRSNKNTYHEIRRISDRLCKENDLSVIVPQGKGKSYDDYHPGRTSGSWREKLKAAIDNLIPQAKDFEDLLKLMQAQGYQIKHGKYISFSAEGQERFTRLKSLGDGYTDEAVKQKIKEKPERKTENKSPLPTQKKPTATPPPMTAPANPANKKPEAIKPLIDIAGNPKFAESRGLTQWAKLQNLKNRVSAFNLMMEYGGLQSFYKLLSECRTDIATIENGISANTERIKSLKYFRDDIATYYRTRPIYKQYTETKVFKERFRTKHENEITGHEIAEVALQDYKRPLPKLKDITAEIEKIETANVRNNKALANKKTELLKLQNIADYLDHLQKGQEPERPPEHLQREPKQHKRSYDFDR